MSDWLDRLLRDLEDKGISEHHRTYLRAKLFVEGPRRAGASMIVPPWIYEALRDELDPLPKQPSKDDRPFFDPDAPNPPWRWSNETPTLAELRAAWERMR